jgi:hypothetical protein
LLPTLLSSSMWREILGEIMTEILLCSSELVCASTTRVPYRHHPAARYRGQVEGEGEVYDARDDTEAWCESVGWKPLCSRKSRNDHVLLHRVPEEDGGQDAGGDYLVMIEVMVALIPKT